MNGLPRLPRQSSGSGGGSGPASGASQRSSRRAALMLSDAPGSISGGADDAAAESLPFAAGGVAAAAAAALHSHMDDTATPRGGTARAATRPPLQQGKDASLSAPSTAAAQGRSASPSPPPLAATTSVSAAESATAFPSTLKLRTSISSSTNASGGGVGGVGGSSAPPAAPQAMQSVRTLHSSVQATLGSIQTKTSLILQEQERDLLRSFQTRLGEVAAELEKERKKNESGSIEWVQRCRKLTEELEWLRELTETLSGENKQLLLQNRRAARSAATQEQDRAFLIKQLVAVKKENARLRFLVEQQMAENQFNMQQQQQQQQHMQQQHQPQGQAQLAQSQQAQLMPASGSNSLAPSPPLTQRTLAAHNGNGNSGNNNVQSPKTKHALVSSSLSPRRRSSSSASATAAAAAAATAATPVGAGSMLPLALPQAPGNMRTSILAAATTEGGGFSPFPARRPATVMGDYLPPTAAAMAAGVGGRAAGGAQTARLSTAPASTPGSHLSPPHTHTQPLLPGPPLSSNTESRLKSAIASLKRRLDSEVVAHRAARAAYLAEVASRNQLQHLFKQCVDTVREQAATRKAQQQQQATSTQPSAPGVAGAARPGATPASLSVATVPLTSLPPLDPRSVPYTELNESDRLAIVEWMLSQRSVMMLLFDRTFPAGAPAPPPQQQQPSSSLPHSQATQQAQQSTGLRHTQMFLPEGGPFPPANTVPLHYSYVHFAHPSKTHAAPHAHAHAHAQAHTSPPPPIRGTHEITPSVHVRAPWRHAASEDEEEDQEHEHGRGDETTDGPDSRRSLPHDEDEEDGPAQAVLYSSGVATAADAANSQETDSHFGSMSIAAMIAGGGRGSGGSGHHSSSSQAHVQGGPVFIGKSHRAPPMQVQRLLHHPNSARHHEAKE